MKKPVKIIVLAGKGGVGKSTVATGLALALSKRGHKVLMFDTDIDGPNCRRLLGVMDKVMYVDSFMHPIDVNENLKLFSVDGHPFIAKEGYGCVWLGEQTRQFLNECLEAAKRGKIEADYYVFDAPANHGDELHTIGHILGGVDHAVLVTAPSIVATDNVALTIRALREMQWSILGLVENFAHFTCSHGERYYVYGQGHGRELAMKENIEFLGELPINPAISGRMAETGEALNNPVIYDVVKKLEDAHKGFWKKLVG